MKLKEMLDLIPVSQLVNINGTLNRVRRTIVEDTQVIDLKITNEIKECEVMGIFSENSIISILIKDIPSIYNTFTIIDNNGYQVQCVEYLALQLLNNNRVINWNSYNTELDNVFNSENDWYYIRHIDYDGKFVKIF